MTRERAGVYPSYLFTSKLRAMQSRPACTSARSPVAIICTIRLPRQVPSVGPAKTGRPQAAAVSSSR